VALLVFRFFALMFSFSVLIISTRVLLIEHAAQHRDQTEDYDADLSRHAVGAGGLAVDRRKQEQRKREERAFEWLQSV
jgi:hypothetical protein